MTNRYYPRFAGKGDNFQELYEVADSRTNHAVSEKMPYHEALVEVESRNDGTFVTAQSKADILMALAEAMPPWALPAIVAKLAKLKDTP